MTKMTEFGKGFFTGGAATIFGFIVSALLLRWALLTPVCIYPWGK